MARKRILLLRSREAFGPTSLLMTVPNHQWSSFLMNEDYHVVMMKRSLSLVVLFIEIKMLLYSLFNPFFFTRLWAQYTKWTNGGTSVARWSR